ncbi:hypothetical protein, conserved [Eimeria tenella]|uniref:Uncharacterized protein n=1 Tax=Eimeria tenella TaxID=5802 RepID=U6KNH3_EIMTE|nr:hypothetical protein, conserved [Eimeria tenella]CDJ39531.1 hypothetical protein, conserved [Eimeria tenella]|eukprot:XP_013230286.1 hypothetical protein, conserved [Eimeria tenella]
MEPRRTSGSSADSRSLSVSSDSDALDEPTVLEEARQGSAAADAPRSAKGRSRINSIRSKRPAPRSPNHVASRSSRGVLTSGSRLLGSADAVTEGGLFRRGLSSGRRPTRVSFVDEQDKHATTSSSSESSSRPIIDFTISRQSKEPTEQPAAPQPDMKAHTACRALAIANANRNMAAIAAEKQALDDTESPAIDAVEMEIDNLNHQLRDVKDSLHKHCLTILNSLVGDKWTIDTSDTLAKRMLRPSKWSTASQVQKEAHQANEDNQSWFGPSAIDVFGDSLVIEEKNPYRIVGVFARRYQDTRQRIPYLDDLVCSGVLPCIQHLEPPVGRPQLLQAPLEPLSPIKAFPDRGSLPPSKLSRNSADPNDANTGSAERISRRDVSSHSRGSHFRVASMPAPPRAPWGIAKQVMKNRKGACCVAQCPVPCSRYVCVLPAVNYTRSSAPASYATVNIENNNMRIPSRLVDYLDKNCVAVERPSWDKSSTKKHTKVKYTDSRRSRSSTQSDDTDSSWGEDGIDKGGAWASGTCEIPPMLPTSIASGLPQFFRREVGNRWLPTLFTDADIRISEYWKLENMKNREKAAWVYQGTHAEPKPYPWEEVPLEGRPLSRKEIAQQRKDAKSRRHISRDAELLLRGVAQSTTWDGEASVVHAGTFFRKNSTEVVLVQERVWLLLGNIAALLECKHLANSGGSTFQMAVKAICVYN